MLSLPHSPTIPLELPGAGNRSHTSRGAQILSKHPTPVPSLRFLPSLAGRTKVFGSEARLGNHAKQHTISGRIRNDPELVFWRKLVCAWDDTYRHLELISWEKLHRPQFPVFARLHEIQRKGDAAFCSSSSSSSQIARVKREQQAGKAAGRWIRVLDHVMPDVYLRRLQHGGAFQRQTYRQIMALEMWKSFVQKGWERAEAILARLELLTSYRILTKTKVLLCTVDSTERMMREMTDRAEEAASYLGIDSGTALATLSLDTAILDEAACVLETAMPVILALGVNNLTLVGDQRQLQPFSMVKESSTTKHTRSFMERALDVGYPSHFLDIQYRMHPHICQVRFEAGCTNRLTICACLRTPSTAFGSRLSRCCHEVTCFPPFSLLGRSQSSLTSRVVTLVDVHHGPRIVCHILVLTIRFTSRG